MFKKFLTSFTDIEKYNQFLTSVDVVDPNISVVNNIVKFGFDNNIYTFDDIKNNYDLFKGCMFMYEDQYKDIIPNWTALDYSAVISFNEYNIAPYLAKHMGIYNFGVRIGEVNISSIIVSFGERKYRVGLMSDVHYNDETVDTDNGTYTDDSSEYHEDLINALGLYQRKEEVKFVCAAGDISSDSIRHILNFKQALNEYSPTTNFYSCFGNHDFKAVTYNLNEPIGSSYNDIGLNVEDKTRLETWNTLITPENSAYQIHYQDPSTEYGKSSYWFEVPIQGTNKSDIYVFLSVNYNLYDSIATNVLDENSPNIQPLIDYVGFMPSSYNLQFYDNATLIWFKNVLEQFNNKRVFIFTHQFFVHKTGSNNIDNGLYHYGGIGDRWRMQPTSAYCLCGIQFEFLNKLNNEYKNTIWFTGHSHLKWNWQTVDPHVNINDNDYDIWRPDDEDFEYDMQYLRRGENDVICKSGFNVHLPSTCRPLQMSPWYNVAPEHSEGAIMDIYEDYVDIRGIIFKNAWEYSNMYYPLAQYRINIKAA